MNKKVSLWYFIPYTVVLMLAAAYYDHLQEIDFETKIAVKEAERLEIIKEREKAYDSINILNVELEEIYLTLDTLETKIATVKTQRNEIPSIVDAMPVTEIDSILTGYVHPR